MSAVFTVFRKEILDVSRDRRTLVFMLVIPTLAIPAVMWLTTHLMTHFVSKLVKERTNILIINPEAAPELVEEIARRSNPKGRARRVVELLAAKGIKERDLASVKGDSKAFLELLKKKKVDPRELMQQVLNLAGEDELGADPDPDPKAVIGLAFPPNLRILTKLDPRFGDPKDPAQREKALLEAIRRDEIAAAVEFEPDTLGRLARGGATRVKVYYLAASDRSEMALNSLRNVFAGMGRHLVARRLKEKGLSPGFASPFRVRPEKLPGPSALVKILGRILPYMILIFALMGATYPAIDLGAGEKERGTLETLLVAPVSRLSIVLGKFFVVLVAAVTSAVLATFSLAVSMQMGIFADLFKGSGQGLRFNLVEAGAALIMIIPVSCIFAALLMAISIFAKSYKEGQSYAAPLQFAIILPAFVSFIPGVKLNWVTASIPVVNISLALKEVFMGNLDQHWAHVALIFASTSVIAGAFLWFATWWFCKEEVLFRS